MKRNLLIFIMLLTIVGFSRAQVVSDFEVIKMNVMYNNPATDSSYINVVPNPDTINNHSTWVGKLLRDKDGQPWCGFWSPLTDSVDVTVNKYVHVKVWKPRISPVFFKLEGGPSGFKEIASMNTQTVVNGWQDMVFDFTSMVGKYHIVSFQPDRLDPVGLTEDITIYFDNIMVNNDPTPNSAPAYVIENFEELMPLNLLLNDPATDLSSMTVDPNPDPTGINTSNYVVKFLRDKDGQPWGGFWSPTPIDLTTNKYVHVKVWKPRISPVYFHIEGGSTGTHEIPSANTQTSTGVWEDMVFNFTAQTGPWTVIGLQPDKMNPVGLTKDMVMYFDDIVVNNDSNPIPTLYTAKLNVNMSYWIARGKLKPATGFVDVAGSFNGFNPAAGSYHLTTTNDSIYSITIDSLLAGTSQFKFRINGSWADSTCEFPAGGPNRTFTISNGNIIYNAWYNNDSVSSVTFNVNMYNYKLLGKFRPATEFVDIAGSFNGFNPATGTYHLTTTNDSIYSITVDSLKFGSVVEFKYRINGSWADSTCEFPAGGPNRKYKIPAVHGVFSAWYNDQGVGIPDNSLSGKITTFPNPVKDLLNISNTTELTKVVITSMVGQEVFRLENVGVGKRTINISELSSGLYFITFYGKSGGQLTEKIMKY